MLAWAIIHLYSWVHSPNFCLRKTQNHIMLAQAIIHPILVHGHFHQTLKIIFWLFLLPRTLRGRVKIHLIFVHSHHNFQQSTSIFLPSFSSKTQNHIMTLSSPSPPLHLVSFLSPQCLRLMWSFTLKLSGLSQQVKHLHLSFWNGYNNKLWNKFIFTIQYWSTD